MNDWDMILFRHDLKVAVRKVHNDKASKVVTHLNIEDKEYKVIIKERMRNKK